jgi:hypothetical protein
MLRAKLIFAAVVVAAMVSAVPSGQAQTAMVVASGSSAMWQTMALAAWSCSSTLGKNVTAPCNHWTDSTKFNLTDSRPSTGSVTDTGDIWVVWDSYTGAGGPHYWAYINVDSVVGLRCFFAQPRCTITTGGSFTSGGKISSALWGADAALPASLQTVFTSGIKVTAAASDIRPEDGLWATCRANSKSGQGNHALKNVPLGFDATDGLGYNTNNPAGECPANLSGDTFLKGNAILSGVSPSTKKANILAFNVSGTDPFTGTAIPTTTTTVSVGALPIVFFYSTQGAGHPLFGLSDVSTTQLRNLFSGTGCDGSTVGGAAGAIDVYQREPLSGTMNTTEATTFRQPVNSTGTGTDNDDTGLVYGASQETGVAGANPLNAINVPCTNSSLDANAGRFRVIGTGEMVASVKASITAASNTWSNEALDGFGYAFNGFGNFSSIAGNASFGYVSVGGVDPIFATHPVNNQLPLCTYPCSEAVIWGAIGTSYPHVRDGSYQSWSVVRMVADGVSKTNVTNMVNASHTFAVNSVAEYVPALATSGDNGLTVWRSHYQQVDGVGTHLSNAGSNGTFATNGNSKGGDKGGDMGGCILTKPGTVALGGDETVSKYLQDVWGHLDAPPVTTHNCALRIID